MCVCAKVSYTGKQHYLIQEGAPFQPSLKGNLLVTEELWISKKKSDLCFPGSKSAGRLMPLSCSRDSCCMLCLYLMEISCNAGQCCLQRECVIWSRERAFLWHFEALPGFSLKVPQLGVVFLYISEA